MTPPEFGNRFCLWNTNRNLWSFAIFGTPEQRNSDGPVKHLMKEAGEVLAAGYPEQTQKCIAEVMRQAIEYIGHLTAGIVLQPNPQAKKKELVDCLFLVMDAISRENITMPELMDELEMKLTINKARTWPAASASEPVEHVRE